MTRLRSGIGSRIRISATPLLTKKRNIGGQPTLHHIWQCLDIHIPSLQGLDQNSLPLIKTRQTQGASLILHYSCSISYYVSINHYCPEHYQIKPRIFWLGPSYLIGIP